MPSNSKNLAELLNTDSTVAAGDVADGSITTAKLADGAVSTAKVADNAITSAKAVNLGRRNLIVNGDMRINQRVGPYTATGYTLDRFNVAKSNFDELVIAITKDTDNPSGNGFASSLKLAVTTAETGPLASDELLYLDHRFEGQNLQHLCYGTSSAKSLTLSFWVKSPLAGKHSVNFYTAPVRSNLQAYTVSSANTWEKKTITIAGDQTGALTTDNSAQMILFWPLAGGDNFHGTPHSGWGAYDATNDYMFSDQVNLAGQTGNFYITGVQLEVGTVATDFEHRPVGEEVAICKRYYNRLGDYKLRERNQARTSQNPDFQHNIWFPTMRGAPTINTYQNSTYSTSGVNYNNAAALAFSNITESSAISSIDSSTAGAGVYSAQCFIELVQEL